MRMIEVNIEKGKKRGKEEDEIEDDEVEEE